MRVVETDALIIGTGIAGLSTALHLSHDRERQVVLVTRAEDPTEGSTRYAQGGIVTLGRDDSPDLLVQDIKRCLAYFKDNPVTKPLTEKEAGGYKH